MGVPVTVPVVALNDSPAGRPVTDHDTMDAVDDESAAVGTNGVMAAPVTVVGGAGTVRERTLLMVQVNEADELNPAESDTVTSTVETPAVVGVPDSVPDAASTDTPTGNPVAE